MTEISEQQMRRFTNYFIETFMRELKKLLEEHNGGVTDCKKSESQKESS